MHKFRNYWLIGGAITLLTSCALPLAPGGPMGFFVTSVGIGKGADLGGLAGADAHCQKLAAAAGAGSRTWRAYLSVPPHLRRGANAPAVAAINARDRIGNGPWFNAKGELIARDVAHLHNGNNISKATALDETRQRRQGPRRQAERTRHPDRLARRRHRLRAADRHHLQGLDQQHRRRGHRRPPRPQRPVARELGQVLELLAPVGRLQPGGAGAHRRRGPLLLLRGGLSLVASRA